MSRRGGYQARAVVLGVLAAIGAVVATVTFEVASAHHGRERLEALARPRPGCQLRHRPQTQPVGYAGDRAY